ncbi:MAG: hypothetical protein K0A90_07805 [Methanosarcinaceae archaeon]|nr:hypothetical protein [Methanosarcinaceae archaeon]
MDIDEVLVYLSQIDINNLHATKHFKVKFDMRKDKIGPDLNDMYTTIINEKPVAILKQDHEKFKLGYELNDDYDLIIIISINTKQSISIKLVTTFIEKSAKRRRIDGP